MHRCSESAVMTHFAETKTAPLGFNLAFQSVSHDLTSENNLFKTRRDLTCLHWKKKKKNLKPHLQGLSFVFHPGFKTELLVLCMNNL